MFCHRGIGANVDVVGAVLGCFGGLLEPSWGPLGVILGALGGSLGARWAFWDSCWVLLGSPCRPLGCSLNLLALSQAGQRVNRTTVDGSTGNGSTESGSVAGSGAQPLLDNNNNNNNNDNNNDNPPSPWRRAESSTLIHIHILILFISSNPSYI